MFSPEHDATEVLIRESTIPFTILRNNWYTENYLDTAQQAIATSEIVGSAGEGRVASAGRADFAAAAAVVLTTDGHQGRTYELAGDVTWTFAELAVVLSDLAGRPVTYRSVTTEQHVRSCAASDRTKGPLGSSRPWTPISGTVDWTLHRPICMASSAGRPAGGRRLGRRPSSPSPDCSDQQPGAAPFAR